MATDQDTAGPDPQSSPLLTAITTEHFVLQTARGVISSEATSRATIFLGVMSSALVALGFTSASSDIFVPFVAAVLPVVVVLGFMTFVRLVQIGVEDVTHLIAIQRIRRFYGRLDPGAAEFFADAGIRDTPDITLSFMALRGGSGQLVFTAASVVGVVTVMLIGAGVALALAGAGFGIGAAAATGVLAAVALAPLLVWYQRSAYARLTFSE